MDETPPPPNVDASALSEIAKGVFVIGDRRVPLVPNIGIVLGDDSALVIDTGMGPANGAKVLEVGSHAPRQSIAATDHTVFGNGGDEDDLHHTATAALMCGCG